MAIEDITDGKVFPEDRGTDAPADYTQPDSAGFFGGLARHTALLQYVETGLGLSADYGANTLDISSGLAFLLVDGSVTVQNEAGEYSDTWNSGMAIAVDVPGVTDIPLTASSTNHVFLAVDMSAANGAYYEVNTTDERPTDPYVKIGEVDTVDNNKFELNRDPEGTFRRVFAGNDVDDPDALKRQEWIETQLSDLETSFNSDLATHTDTSAAHHSRPNAGAGLTESGNSFELAANPTVTGDLTVDGVINVSLVLAGWLRGDSGDFEAGGTSLRARFNNFFVVRDRTNNNDIARFYPDRVELTRGTTIDDTLEVTGGITGTADEATLWDGYELQKNGTDGTGIINFHTE